jgi:ATP-dependent Zn protease
MSYNRKQRRLSTAKHEAGHGLVLLALDHPFKSIEIIPGEITIDTPNMGFVLDRGDLCLGVVRTDAVAWLMGGHCMEADDRIMQALAGVAGEQIDWKKPVFKRGDWKEAARSDMEDAKQFARLTKTKIEPEFHRAWELLRRYRKAHAALVEALLEKSLLTYEECKAIWEANRG